MNVDVVIERIVLDAALGSFGQELSEELAARLHDLLLRTPPDARPGWAARIQGPAVWASDGPHDVGVVAGIAASLHAVLVPGPPAPVRSAPARGSR